MKSFFLALALGSGMYAASIVDQSQLTATLNMAAFNQAGLAQSFAPSYSNVSGAAIELTTGVGTGAQGDITISLYDNLPNANGNLLASATATGVTAVGSGEAWATVYWTPVVVTASNTYYLVFTGTNTQLAVAGAGDNPYANGNTFANDYSSFAGSGFDYTFQTFSDDSSSATPEPATSAAMVLGCATLAFVRKRLSR